MKVVVCGSRTIGNRYAVYSAIEDSGFTVSEIVHGDASGPDSIAGGWARSRGIPVKIYHADWESYGRAAGPKRNMEMAEYCDAVVAVWDGKSRGTKNMIYQAEQVNKPVHIVIYDKENTQ